MKKRMIVVVILALVLGLAGSAYAATLKPKSVICLSEVGIRMAILVASVNDVKSMQDLLASPECYVTGDESFKVTVVGRKDRAIQFTVGGKGPLWTHSRAIEE